MRHVPHLLSVVLLVAVTGCASGPEQIGPTGVDQLTIPTPSPDPEDFVDRIDNPLLPLTPGSRWSYRVTGAEGVSRVSVAVTSAPRQVAGVATTTVTTTERGGGGRALGASSAWFAQDRDGNVWLFAERAPGREWAAGVGGAQAGLAMPAAPRVGDAYEQQSAPGVAEDTVTVLSVAETLTPGVAGPGTGLLLTEQRSALDPAAIWRWYAVGIGVVRQRSEDGTSWELRDHRGGDAGGQ